MSVAMSILTCGVVLVFGFFDFLLKTPREKGLHLLRLWRFYWRVQHHEKIEWVYRATLFWPLLCVLAVAAQLLEFAAYLWLVDTLFGTQWLAKAFEVLDHAVVAIPLVLVLALRWSRACWMGGADKGFTPWAEFSGKAPIDLSKVLTGAPSLVIGLLMGLCRYATQNWHDETVRLHKRQFLTVVRLYAVAELYEKPEDVLSLQQRYHQTFKAEVDKLPQSSLSDDQRRAWEVALDKAQMHYLRNIKDVETGDLAVTTLSNAILEAWYGELGYEGVRALVEGDIRVKTRVVPSVSVKCNVQTNEVEHSALVCDVSHGHVAVNLEQNCSLKMGQHVDLTFASIPPELQAYLPSISCRAEVKRAKPLQAMSEQNQRVILSFIDEGASLD